MNSRHDNFHLYFENNFKQFLNAINEPIII